MRDYTTLHLVTKNDTNGNPRRLYILLKKDDNEIDSSVVAVCDQGYQSWPKNWPPAAIRIDIPISEYRWWLKVRDGIAGREYKLTPQQEGNA